MIRYDKSNIDKNKNKKNVVLVLFYIDNSKYKTFVIFYIIIHISFDFFPIGLSIHCIDKIKSNVNHNKRQKIKPIAFFHLFFSIPHLYWKYNMFIIFHRMMIFRDVQMVMIVHNIDGWKHYIIILFQKIHIQIILTDHLILIHL